MEELEAPLLGTPCARRNCCPSGRGLAVGSGLDFRGAPAMLHPFAMPMIKHSLRRFGRFWDRGRFLALTLILGYPALALAGPGRTAKALPAPLAISVYATAGDVVQHLASDEARRRVVDRLRALRVTRVFLEGRRGDEYVNPQQLAQVRADLEGLGLKCSGGIATVPGQSFGTRQVGDLGWLNWESEKTRRDVAGFFTENAPVFDELIVDDFFCTADTSPASEQARAGRSWGEYRRDLLVSLIRPLMVQPTRRARADTRLILKFPQWYDRFHLFGYDVPRMAAPFREIWVGTEVRNPLTRRMGFVPPTEGYINFSWIRSVAGAKVVGAWFDHIECTPENFTDQAWQSVLAGARELTLFRLGDVMEPHPGDARLAGQVEALGELAAKVQQRKRRGVPFYKPPGSDPGENLYLADYLAALGWPILPVAQYPSRAKTLVLGAQAAADREIMRKVKGSLRAGATVVITPDFLRRAGPEAASLAGVEVSPKTLPGLASTVRLGKEMVVLSRPLDVDRSLRITDAATLLTAEAGIESWPGLTRMEAGRGAVLVLNVRTFAEEDFRAAGEWLLAPRALGLSELAEPVVNALRQACLAGLVVPFRGPAGVGFYAFDRAQCVHNFQSAAVQVQVDGRSLRLEPHECRWVEGTP